MSWQDYKNAGLQYTSATYFVAKMGQQNEGGGNFVNLWLSFIYVHNEYHPGQRNTHNHRPTETPHVETCPATQAWSIPYPLYSNAVRTEWITPRWWMQWVRNGSHTGDECSGYRMDHTPVMNAVGS